MSKTFAEYLRDRTTDLATRYRVLRQAPYVVGGATPVYSGRKLPGAGEPRPFSRESILSNAGRSDVVVGRPSRSDIRSTE